MFKKLKDKITEEVKISPQRFQQLTQSVSDKLQGTSTPDESMFSIGEDDEHSANTSATDQGFSSVNLVSPSSEGRTRRLSNSSMASDISFLPRYESGSMYHLQSDFDASASELEDNVSQSSSKLGHLSKEQVHAAFQKSQLRYHKYRGRYTDLARHYKELERENAKMKSVLVETQDKAIRRVTELKEQCSLEQKAKAHLENALRDEIDEKQLKIQSLQTKIGLLQQSRNHTNVLVQLDESEATCKVDSDKLEQLTKYLNDARGEIEALNGKIQEYKARDIVFQTKEHDYKSKIITLERDIADFAEREKENNLRLAENKMELHNEMLGKESEISRLKQEVESLRAHEKDSKPTKMENLQSQNNKLIEKLENATVKCNGLENELLKMEKFKMDIEELRGEKQKLEEQNRRLQSVNSMLKTGLSTCQENLHRLSQEKQELSHIIKSEQKSYEAQITQLRDSAKKRLLTLEKEIFEKINSDYEAKENALKDHFEQQIREISASNDTATEIHQKIGEKDDIIKSISQELKDIRDRVAAKEEQYRELESTHLELIEESSLLKSVVNNMERHISETANEDNKGYEKKIEHLEVNMKTLQDELGKLRKISNEKEKQNVHLAKENLKLQTSHDDLVQKFRLMEEKEEAAELEITETNLLEMKVQALEEEKKTLLDSFELERKLFNKVLEEHNDIKVKEITIADMEQTIQTLEQKVIELKGYLKQKDSLIVDLNKMKLDLEENLAKAREQLRIQEEREVAVELDKTECNLLQIKVQQMENEKDRLLKSFEQERETFDQSFHQHKEEFLRHKEDIIQENVELAKENLELKRVNDELTGKTRLIEEKEQLIELESSECNLLKLKVQELEQERVDLEKGYEAERELFNKVMVEHKDLKLKDERIKHLEGSVERLTAKVAKLNRYLKNKEETIVKLHKDNLTNEQEVAKLTEALKIKEEEIDSLQIEKTECGLLEMKLKAIEEENHNLLNSFELERSTFEDALAKGSLIENRVDDLVKKLIAVNQEKSDLEEAVKLEKQDLIDSFEVERKNFQITDAELRKIAQENQLLKEEKNTLNSRLKEETEMLGEQVNILKEETSRLQTDNEALRKELDIRQEKLDELTVAMEKLTKDLKHGEEKCQKVMETSRKEKSEKKQAISKIKEMQQELDKNNEEIKAIKIALESVEKLYNEAKSIHSGDLKVLADVRQKCDEFNNEKLKLEKDLKKKSDEFQFKLKEMGVIEQQLGVVRQEKEALTYENKHLRERIEEVAIEGENLRALTSKAKELEQVKKQNEVLQNECDKLNQGISELKVQINQLDSDNRHVNEEHDKLMSEVEEYKVKYECVENEKGQMQKERLETEEERNNLRVAVTDLTEKLERTLKEKGSQNPDLAQIQRDFLEIKDKCDKLHLENKNLKTEYSKLEDQFNSFRKIKKDLETQLSKMEHQYNEVTHEKQLLQDEVHELKILPVNHSNGSNKLDDLAIVKEDHLLLSSLRGPQNGPINPDRDRLQLEIDALRDKVVQYKSLDLTNKSSLEFYENELQKLKNKNEKLNRTLDETLVTLNHCTELSSSTEIEYLKNVLYNYMLGKESLVLARVIAAVCKFDPAQTEAVLQKEQQKQTLLGQLGIL
ncbi:putative leucine-rich repeat-containing protein DDB_G0290503 isoform X1 [Euwallacea fornicatus]|uniref:putative leucine-rich repeat-containing protein DDB_G0290503 isoform X1 n=1 Tax=Euwallacea fornicatus TaxID=995702 RepID=UPI00338EC703